jgi:DNA-binding GntR family transcriptional regulator
MDKPLIKVEPRGEQGSSQPVYEAIRQKIISMEYLPGFDLDEKTLVEIYGVSRTPVREALIRLAAEGLVEIKRNRGAFVAPLDLTTLQSFFEAADFVQRAIMRLAAMRSTAADLKQIGSYLKGFERAVASHDTAAMVDLNHRFHESIGNAARNKYLMDSYRRILVDHERIAQLCYDVQSNDEEATKLTLKQHRGMYEALQKRDAERAEKIAKAHFDFCKEGIRRVIASGDGKLHGIEITIAGS